MSETKSSMDVACSRFKTIAPTHVFGLDAVGSKGGLLVLGWSQNHVDIVRKHQNLILRKISNFSGKNMVYLLFVWGSYCSGET